MVKRYSKKRQQKLLMQYKKLRILIGMEKTHRVTTINLYPITVKKATKKYGFRTVSSGLFSPQILVKKKLANQLCKKYLITTKSLKQLNNSFIQSLYCMKSPIRQVKNYKELNKQLPKMEILKLSF